MKIIKRNQVVIMVVALMLVTAGYLNFIEMNNKNTTIATSSNDTIGEATLVSNDDVVETKEENAIDEAAISLEEGSDNDKDKENTDQYFSNSRLQRDTMYSQIIESYQKMIESETLSAEQKAIAQNEITKINNKKNAIMITENLIKTKGFSDVVILNNDESINVILQADELKQEEIAQVQNIISREMKAEIANIHISKH